MRYNWSSAPSALYQWHQVIAWHDSVANTLNIQVDHGAVSSVSYNGGAKDTTSPMIIGAHSDGSLGFNGLIDELVFCTLFCMSPLYSMSQRYTEIAPRSTEKNQFKKFRESPC